MHQLDQQLNKRPRLSPSPDFADLLHLDINTSTPAQHHHQQQLMGPPPSNTSASDQEDETTEEPTSNN